MENKGRVLIAAGNGAMVGLTVPTEQDVRQIGLPPGAVITVIDTDGIAKHATLTSEQLNLLYHAAGEAISPLLQMEQLYMSLCVKTEGYTE